MANDIYEAVNFGGRAVIRCTDCLRWIDASGGVVTHSRRCDHSDDATVHGAGPQTASERRAAAKQMDRAELAQMAAKARRSNGLVAAAFGGDEGAIVEAVKLGLLSESDAMNRDD